MTSDPVLTVLSAVGGIATAATAVVALSISAWNTFRIARAERPVEWIVTPRDPEPGENLWVVELTPAGADAVGLGIQFHWAERSFTYATTSVLRVGEVMKFGVLDAGRGDTWIRLSWAHPRDRNRPHTAWFPLFPQGRAYEEWVREGVRNPALNWVRRNVLRSPVRPGGITGRRAGWPERRVFAKDLRDRKVKRWRPGLLYEKPKGSR